MRLTVWHLVVAVLLGVLVVDHQELSAAKKKSVETVPVKIIKPSDAKYKQAAIIQSKEPKKKRFLWFKKKQPERLKPKMAKLPEGALEKSTLQPKKVEEKVVVPKAIVPELETPKVEKNEATISPSHESE